MNVQEGDSEEMTLGKVQCSQGRDGGCSGHGDREDGTPIYVLLMKGEICRPGCTQVAHRQPLGEKKVESEACL